MKKIRLVPVLLAAISFGNAFADESVTGYSYFQTAYEDQEDEAFDEAQIKAYQQCYERGLQPREETTMETIFPSLWGMGDSDCTVSDPFAGPYRYYICEAWYKTECVSTAPAVAENSESEDASSREYSSSVGYYTYDDGAGGAGGAGSGSSYYETFGAEGSPGW